MRLYPRLGFTLLFACLVYNVAVAAIGWNNTILETMPFRQTQTALSARFMLGHHYRILYETPLFGPPWCIPFEFPLYQWITAGLATLTGCPLDQAGRLVNRAFFLLTLIPCYALLQLLGLPLWSRLATLCLFLVSPFYLFWSRTFMIESTALFLAMSYLACCVAFAKQPRVGSGFLALVFGCLAALVKITTFAGPVLLVAFALLWLAGSWLRGHLSCRDWAVRSGVLLLLAVVPIALGVAWTRLADEQKKQNPIADKLTSDGLTRWNFGSPQRRYQKETWDIILSRTPLAVAPWTPGGERLTFWLPWLVLAATVPGLVFAWRRNLLILCCLAAFFALPFVFTNLHEFHEYYAYATNIYLISAIGIGLAALHDGGRVLRAIGHVLTAALLVLAVAGFWQTYVPLQRTNVQGLLPACTAVRERTTANDVILVLGCDWSSEVPYYCERRALAIPSWESIDWTDFARYLALVDDYRIGALVVQRPQASGGLVTEQQIVTAKDALRARGYTLQPCYEDDLFEVFEVQR